MSHDHWHGGQRRAMLGQSQIREMPIPHSSGTLWSHGRMVLAVGTDGVAGRHVPADDIGVGRRHLPGPRQSCDWSRLRLRSLPALRALCRISFRGSGIWRVNRVEVSHGFTVRSAGAHARDQSARAC
jgi:hypothetical protein